MKICILILYTRSWKPIADIVLPNLWEYCKKHGYDWDIMRFDDPYPSDFGFNKLIHSKRLLSTYDFVWSLDLDTLITNHDKKVEDFIDNKHDFFITKDVNGINAGSFIVRKSEYSLFLLEWLLALKGEEGMHCEQDAINFYYKVYENKKIKILPHPSINSYMYELYPEHNITEEKDGQWKEGSFVLHLPGIGMKTREHILKETKVVK
jgi:hypothetical protein